MASVLSSPGREGAFLRGRWRGILTAVGFMLSLHAPLGLVTALAALVGQEGLPSVLGHLIPALGSFLVGFALWRGPLSVTDPDPTPAEGGVVVVLGWSLVMLVSAVPFMWISGLSFSRAFFESVSGWTTTGLSVVDVSVAPPSILLWRSLIQLAGGAGLAILVMSALVGTMGMGIAGAEGRTDQLLPQVRSSARLVLAVYLATTAGGVVALRLAGMGPFDAVNHAFTAVSTGGFSTRPESLGYWNSPAVEGVIVALMWLGNLNFVTAWLLWRGRLRAVAGNGEVRLTAVVLPLAALGVFLTTCLKLYPRLDQAVRVAIFETTSALTTSGFSTVSYGDWGSAGVAILILLMLIGGGTCSTAGGLKQLRVYLLWRNLLRGLGRLLKPRGSVVPLQIVEGESTVVVGDERLWQVSWFLHLYLILYGAGVWILCVTGYSLQQSLFEVASSLGTVGLSVGVTAPDMPDVALWVETAAMFLGRLEITVVFISAVRILRDARAMVRKG